MARPETDALLRSPQGVGARLLLALWLPLACGCGGLWGALNSDMVLAVERGPGGVITEADVEGPDFWIGGTAATRPLATDPTGWKVAVTDGRRVGVWDAGERRFDRVLPRAGHVVVGARFSDAGSLLIVEEEESGRSPGLTRLRVVNLEAGRTISTLSLPCGCLVDFVVDETEQTLKAILSSEAIAGTWVFVWSIEGGLQRKTRISRRALGSSQRVSFVDSGRGLLWVEAVFDLVTAQYFGLNVGGSPGPRRFEWKTDLECGQGCVMAAHVQGGKLLLAFGGLDGQSFVGVFETDGPERRLTFDLGESFPLAWMPIRGSGVGLLSQRVDAETGALSWGLRRFDLASGQLSDVSEKLSLPVAGNMRFPGGWFASRAASPFRGLFGLPEKMGSGRWQWFKGRTHMSVDPRSGATFLGSPWSDWLLRSGAVPKRLAQIHLLTSMGAVEAGVTSRSGRGALWRVSSQRVMLVAAQEPGAQAPRRGVASVPAVVELDRWTPTEPGSRLVDHVKLDGRRLLLLVKAGDRATLVLLGVRGADSLEVVGRRVVEVEPGAGRWHLVLNETRDEVALLSLSPRGVGAILKIQPFGLPLLELGPQRTMALPTPPRGLTHQRGLATVVVHTQTSLTEVPVWGGPAAPRSWTPPPWARIRGVTPLGVGTVAVRLVGQFRGSEEHWLFMDLRHSAPLVLGHRRFSLVVAARFSVAEGLLHVLEQRGVLTTFSLREAGLRVEERAYLHPEGEFSISLRRGERPQFGGDRAQAMRFLLRGRIIPVEVGGDGRVGR